MCKCLLKRYVFLIFLSSFLLAELFLFRPRIKTTFFAALKLIIFRVSGQWKMGEALNKKRKVRSMSFFTMAGLLKALISNLKRSSCFFSEKRWGSEHRNEQEIQPKFYSLFKFKSASMEYTVYRVKWGPVFGQCIQEKLTVDFLIFASFFIFQGLIISIRFDPWLVLPPHSSNKVKVKSMSTFFYKTASFL